MNIATVDRYFTPLNQDQQDGFLCIAYAMMKSGLFKQCECSFFNEAGTEFINDTLTDKTPMDFDKFYQLYLSLSEGGLHCVCALNNEDSERISLTAAFTGRGYEMYVALVVFLTKSRKDNVKRYLKIYSNLMDKANKVSTY